MTKHFENTANNVFVNCCYYIKFDKKIPSKIENYGEIQSI